MCLHQHHQNSKCEHEHFQQSCFCPRPSLETQSEDTLSPCKWNVAATFRYVLQGSLQGRSQGLGHTGCSESPQYTVYPLFYLANHEDVVCWDGRSAYEHKVQVTKPEPQKVNLNRASPPTPTPTPQPTHTNPSVSPGCQMCRKMDKDVWLYRKTHLSWRWWGCWQVSSETARLWLIKHHCQGTLGVEIAEATRIHSGEVRVEWRRAKYTRGIARWGWDLSSGLCGLRKCTLASRSGEPVWLGSE